MDEQKFTNYFLGKLTKIESESFEEEIAINAELSELAQMVESELIDHYLRDNFSASDKKLFETNYLITEVRNEKLNLAKSLWKIANEQKAQKIGAIISQPSFWQIWNAWRVAFAAIAMLLLFGTIIFFWLNSRSKIEIVQQNNTNQTPITKTENQNIQPIENINIANQKANIPTNLNTPPNKNILPTPEAKPTATPKTIEQSAPTLASFTLFPGTLRSEGEQFIKITPNTNKVNLRLNLPKETSKYQTYIATIKTADGETISTFSNLKALNLNLSANKLEKRTYIILLEGQNAQNPAESIAEYTFQVRR